MKNCVFNDKITEKNIEGAGKMKQITKTSCRLLAGCGIVSAVFSLICLYYILEFTEGLGGIETLSRIDFFGNLSSAALKIGTFAAIVCDMLGRRKK